jgi:hypothetical protein
MVVSCLGGDAMKDTEKKKPARKKRRRQRSSKGALIKGMSRRLPSEILESDVFAEHLRKMMRRYAGIYALYRKRRLYYVGLTRNLLGRINRHLKDRHAGKWDSFIIFRIHRVRYLKDIETLIHRLVDSPGNRQKGNVPRDADLNRVLREVLAAHMGAIRGIRKALR